MVTNKDFTKEMEVDWSGQTARRIPSMLLPEQDSQQDETNKEPKAEPTLVITTATTYSSNNLVELTIRVIVLLIGQAKVRTCDEQNRRRHVWRASLETR